MTIDRLLLEDGGRLLLDIANPAIFDNLMDGADVSNGSNVINYLSAKSYPRDVDAAATTVLFTLNYPVYIAAGATVTMSVRYRDPFGEAASVAGRDMVAPVATTDYLLNAASDGGGADRTANLSVTPIYGANDLYYTLTETSGVTDGYVTKLQARGRGIYIYNPVEYIAQDVPSQNIYGYEPLRIDMKYEQNPDTAKAAADIILVQQKDPRTVLRKISFLANYSPATMYIFLLADIGHTIYIIENQNGISASYYINGIDYTIDPGEIIRVTYTLGEQLSIGTVFWELEEIGYGELDEMTTLGY